MKLIRIAAGIVNQTPLDWDGNRQNILNAIEQAREVAASLLCLPELCISGYGCEDAFLSRQVSQISLEVLQEILPATQGMVVSLGLPLFHKNALFNAACLVADAQVVAFAAKRHLAGEGIHYEPRWFKPWPEDALSQIQIGSKSVPLGDVVVDCAGIRIGFEICEDAWAAARPAAELSARGVDIILNPSASHFAFGKLDVRKRLVLEGSRAFGVSYVYTNLLGCESGRAIYDGGALIASRGQLMACGPRFSFANSQVTSAIVDIDATRMEQARSATFRPDLADANEGVVEVAFEFSDVEPEATQIETVSWEQGQHIKEEEFTRAVSLGLVDYLRKSHSFGFVVSLSGGADSSSVACLVSLMVRLGCLELGRRPFLERLAHDGKTPRNIKNEDQIVQSLLTCVYQATENSSQTTRDAARQVAQAISAEFHEFSVDQFVHGYTDLVAEIEGRILDWDRDDTALQNIQARVRAPSVWMIANIRNALLLSTSNRSEAAVGYATMDGDTCGGLSPIAGIDKAYLRSWLRWLETKGPCGLGPIPALKAVNSQQPTAELRPSSEGQTDERDLMPYEVLDAIERAAIRDKRSPVEVFKLIRTQFVEYDRRQLATWVERFFVLWSRNQWKRERYAPSFHLDDENLDPKTWCRFPILSGGFQRELAAFRSWMAAQTQ